MVLSCLACGGEAAVPDGEWAGAVRDSAGVEIVSNPAGGLWTVGDRWRVSEDLRIGTQAGDPDYQFGAIAGIAELPEGGLVVLDQQAQHLRVFSRDGAYLRTVGGPGSGPGEFGLGAGPVLVGPGDTLFVPDPSNQRLNRFTPAVEPLDSAPIDFSGGFPSAWLDTSDGRIINQVRPLGIGGDQEVSSSDLILERGSDGTVKDTLLTFPSGATFQMRDGVPDFTFFSPEPVWAVTTDDAFVYGYNDVYRIGVYDGSSLVRVIEKPFVSRPVAESEQELIREAMLRAFEEFGLSGPQLEVFRDAIGFAESYPAYALMRGGPEGSLWVQHLQLPSELPPEELENFNPQLGFGAPTWDVFDPAGRFLGELEMPRRYQPLRIDGNRIYGVWRDDLDVQHVLVMRVEWDAADLESAAGG